MQSLYQTTFNNSIISALLFDTLSMTEKEQKIQTFVNESDTRYDELCDNIDYLLMNKDTNSDKNTLYLKNDGSSFIAESGIENVGFPVLTINQYSPDSSDISMYLELALKHFSSNCDYIKTQMALDYSA